MSPDAVALRSVMPDHSGRFFTVAAEPMTDVVFALLPNTVLLDVAGPADAFRIAGEPGSYRLRFVAPQTEVRVAGGLTLGKLEPLPESLAPGTFLVLAGIGGSGVDPKEP